MEKLVMVSLRLNSAVLVPLVLPPSGYLGGKLEIVVRERVTEEIRRSRQ